MNDLSSLEKASSTKFLITLLENNGSLTNSKLLDISKIHSSTFYDRKKDLSDAGLIEIEEKMSKKEDGSVSGPNIWISLTPKGLKIAKKLKEIEEIMNREG